MEDFSLASLKPLEQPILGPTVEMYPSFGQPEGGELVHCIIPNFTSFSTWEVFWDDIRIPTIETAKGLLLTSLPGVANVKVTVILKNNDDLFRAAYTYKENSIFILVSISYLKETSWNSKNE
jgi:hypothetical protein